MTVNRTVRIAILMFCSFWTCFSAINITFAQNQVPKKRDAHQSVRNEDDRTPFTLIDTLFPSKTKGFQNEEWEKIIKSSSKSVIYNRVMQPGESLFIGAQMTGNGHWVQPVVGYKVPEDLNQKWVKTVISIVPPPFEDPDVDLEERKNLTRFYIFYVIQEEGMILPQGLEWTWLPKDVTGQKLTFFKPTISHVPVQIHESQLYTATFAEHNEKTYSLLLAVTNDRSELKKTLDVRQDPKFNWNDWFLRTK